MTTMLDVSRHAGVSKATVSRVLNGTGQVKESTRQKVFNAMQALDYRPNFWRVRWQIAPVTALARWFPHSMASILAVCCNRLHAKPNPTANS